MRATARGLSPGILLAIMPRGNRGILAQKLEF